MEEKKHNNLKSLKTYDPTLKKEKKEESEERELMSISDKLEECSLCGAFGAYIKEEGIYICNNCFVKQKNINETYTQKNGAAEATPPCVKLLNFICHNSIKLEGHNQMAAKCSVLVVRNFALPIIVSNCTDNVLCKRVACFYFITLPAFAFETL